MTFAPDPRFSDELFGSAPVRDMLGDRAAAVAQRASEMAPDDPRTGGEDLHRGIKPEVELDGSRGYVGRVVSHNFKGHWYEFGAAGVRAQPHLRPALEIEVGPIEKGRDS